MRTTALPSPPPALPHSGSAKKLDALTSLRFVAAAMIVVHHSSGHFGIRHDFSGRLVLDQAVSFFFVLSGFILTYVYPTLDSWHAGGRFWLARFARVWPAHFAAFLFLCVLIKPMHFPANYSTLPAAALNLLLVHGWIPVQNIFFSFNPVSWTISTEMAFYLFFPLLLHRWARTWWWKLPVTLLLAFATIVFCTVLPVSSSPVDMWHASRDGLLYINPLARLFEFTVGMTASLLFQRTVQKIQIGRLLGTVLELAALGLAFLNMFETQWLLNPLATSSGLGPNVMIWAGHGPVCVLAFAFLIYVMGLGRGYVSRVLSAPPLVLLGEISFTIYLLHYILLLVFEWRRGALQPYDTPAGFGFFWVFLLVLAWLVWAGFERPVRTRLLALWPNRDPQSIQRQLARAYITPPKSSAWSAVLVPTRRSLGVGGVLLLLLLAPVGYAIAFPAKKLATPAELHAVIMATPKELRGARFEDIMEIVGIQWLPTPTGGGGQLKIACHSLTASFPTNLALAIHFVDAKGNILAQADIAENPAHFHSAIDFPADSWIDTVQVSPEQLAHATAIGITLFQPGVSTALVDRGPRDWANHRLLFSLPSARSPSTEP
jgi:peptidoglycan/LPS O-acetylase OafA/YrhL